MNLLIAVLALTYITASRARGSTRLIRTSYLVTICAVVAAGYLSQKVI
jgi:hypothetical protein